VTKEHYLDEVHHGALYVGSAETVATKIAQTIRALGLQRFGLKYSTGPLSHQLLLESIHMYGTKVIPMVRDILASEARAV
jgi:hypothetical protein